MLTRQAIIQTHLHKLFLQNQGGNLCKKVGVLFVNNSKYFSIRETYEKQKLQIFTKIEEV